MKTSTKRQYKGKHLSFFTMCEVDLPISLLRMDQTQMSTNIKRKGFHARLRVITEISKVVSTGKIK